MKLERSLSSLPADQWTTEQAIVFDWYDGPREGLCSLSRPRTEFYFELLDERPGVDDLDDRLFRVSEISPGSVTRILSVLEHRGSGKPSGSVWVPVWKFKSDKAKEMVEQEIHDVETKKRTTPLVILTRDMEHFLGCWTAEPTQDGATDWFTVFGISAKCVRKGTEESP